MNEKKQFTKFYLLRLRMKRLGDFSSRRARHTLLLGVYTRIFTEWLLTGNLSVFELCRFFRE